MGDDMKQSMQAVIVSAIGSWTRRERPVPRPQAGQVLVRVAVTGLCRTDLKLIRCGHRDLVLPRIPGEEVVGVVAENGPGAVRHPVGTRVYVYPGEWCGVCAPCRSGAENLCREMRIMGFHRDGGFAEYVAVPEESLIALPEGCAFPDAVFAEPLSCCINAIELSRLTAGERMGIWGAGPAGTLLKRLACRMGAEVVVIEPDGERRERIGGRETADGELFDVCIPAVGDGEAYRAALEHLAPRGRLVAFSGLAADAACRAADYNHLHYHEQSVVGAYGCALRHGAQALELIASGSVAVSDLVSHTLPLSALDAALDMVARRRCMKIHLNPQE